MIINFKDKEVEILFRKLKSSLYQNIKKIALRKLILLDEVKDLRELSKLPRNCLEKLGGGKKEPTALESMINIELFLIGWIIMLIVY